eukprot:TRINITY_DN69_c0_g1_i1.p2 TRINITY_DN69_c0_g1~~TRINITY_DN69_c0_g1_i1.p2  ORF type:complete len:782 (-),score=67.87 TRINITY_DN69_c0_g1_i1:21733-24078(-)
MDNSEGTWRISKPMGGRMSKTRPLFANDNETVWVPSGNLVCGFSLRTGLLQSSYTHKSTVLCLDYLEPQQRILSLCRGGMLIQWDVGKKKVVSSLDLGKSVWRAAYSHYTKAHYIISQKEGNSSIQIAKVKEGGVLESLPPIPLPEILGTCKQLTISPSGRTLACIIGKSLLYIHLDHKPLAFAKVDHEVPLISLAISPEDSIIATGDLAGKICYWHVLGLSPTKSTYHWHSHAVECVLFNADGSVLYSGGHEGVMVIWHINTNTRSFLPRFPSQLAVMGISKDGTHLAVGLTNNTMKIINTATLKEIQSISQLHFDPKCFAAAEDPLTKKIVISSSNGTLQFYDISTKRVVDTLDVSFKNYASKTFNEVANPLTITHVVFSSTGEYLLTVEQTGPALENSLVKYELSQLKFWKRAATGGFTLAAIIENPHRGKRITHAIFSGDHVVPSFVTAGEDCRFMVWEYKKVDDSTTWSCTVTGSYKDMPLLQIKRVLSQLCVLHERNVVTIWDCRNSYALVDALYVPYKENLFSCEFSTNGNYMLGLTKSTICSFDLETHSLLWELKVSAFQVSNDPSADSQCCILLSPAEGDKASGLLIVGYESSTPLTICRFKGTSALSKVMYAGLKYKRNSLVVFKNNGQMQKLSFILKGEKMEEIYKEDTVKERADIKIYAAESGTTLSGQHAISMEDRLREQLKAFNEYLDNFKSFDTPSSGTMYQNLLNAVLIKREPTDQSLLTPSIKEEDKFVKTPVEKMELGEDTRTEKTITEQDLQELSVTLQQTQ